MGDLKDIIDIIKDPTIKNAITRSKRFSSVSQQAAEGILQCPVIVSDSISAENAQMVNKALERNYASFIMVCISMNPIIHSDEDITDYLKKFHQNTSMKRDKFSLINQLDPYIESYSCIEDKENNQYILCGLCKDTSHTRRIVEQMIFDNNGGLMQGINEGILNDLVVITEKHGNYKGSYNSSHKKGKPYRKSAMDKATQGTAFHTIYDHPSNDDTVGASSNDTSNYKPSGNNSGNDRGGNNSSNGGGGGTNNNGNTGGSSSSNGKKSSNNTAVWNNHGGGWNDKDTITHRGGFHDTVTQKGKVVHVEKHKGGFHDTVTKINPNEDLSKDIMTNNDVRKANELVPTMLHIRLKVIGDDGSYAGNVDFMLGIKAHMHLVKHEEMMTNMLYGLKNNGKFFNFIRWTSGEISFFKDFLFAIKDVKRDVINRSNGADSFWLSSKQRKEMAKLSDTFFSKHIMPNSTIVMSMDEADYIKSEYGYDLLNESIAYKLINEYFLLAFVIIDSASQIVHFLFEGRKDYESITFSGLERDNENDAKKFKEMLRAINRN